MDKTGLHRGLEARLIALSGRIAALRHKMGDAKGIDKISDFGELDELERRYARLADRLRVLDREGPGFRPDMKAEIEKMADDLTGTAEDFALWIDSGFEPKHRPKLSSQS
jgi:hypothetical protein